MVSKKAEKSTKLSQDDWNRMLNIALQDKSLVLMDRTGQTAVLQHTKSDGTIEYMDMLEDATLSRRKDAPEPQAETAPGTPVCEGGACKLPDKLPAPEEKKAKAEDRVEVPGTGMTQEELDAFNASMIAAQEKKEQEEKEAPKPPAHEEHEERPQSKAPAKQQNRSKEDQEVEAVAKMLDLPTRCLKVVRGGDVMVSAAGLAALADRKGYRAIVIKKLDPIQEVATDNRTGNSTTTGWVCEVALFPKLDSAMVSLGKDMTPDVQKIFMENLMQPITNIGTATNKNCRPEMFPYMREMAVTRAINRAFRVFTACGFTSLEEMQDYQGDEAPA